MDRDVVHALDLAHQLGEVREGAAELPGPGVQVTFFWAGLALLLM